MKTNTRKTLRAYFVSTFEYKYWASFMLLAAISAQVINVITPLFYKDFFNILAEGNPGQESMGQLINILFIIGIFY